MFARLHANDHELSYCVFWKDTDSHDSEMHNAYCAYHNTITMVKQLKNGLSLRSTIQLLENFTK